MSHVTDEDLDIRQPRDKGSVALWIGLPALLIVLLAGFLGGSVAVMIAVALLLLIGLFVTIARSPSRSIAFARLIAVIIMTVFIVLMILLPLPLLVAEGSSPLFQWLQDEMGELGILINFWFLAVFMTLLSIGLLVWAVVLYMSTSRIKILLSPLAAALPIFLLIGMIAQELVR